MKEDTGLSRLLLGIPFPLEMPEWMRSYLTQVFELHASSRNSFEPEVVEFLIHYKDDGTGVSEHTLDDRDWRQLSFAWEAYGAPSFAELEDRSGSEDGLSGVILWNDPFNAIDLTFTASQVYGGGAGFGARFYVDYQTGYLYITATGTGEAWYKVSIIIFGKADMDHLTTVQIGNDH